MYATIVTYLVVLLEFGTDDSRKATKEDVAAVVGRVKLMTGFGSLDVDKLGTLGPTTTHTLRGHKNRTFESSSSHLSMGPHAVPTHVYVYAHPEYYMHN